MITGGTELVEAMAGFPVKMVIKVVRVASHKHDDGSQHEGQWAVLVQPLDGERKITKIEPWMVAATTAAIGKLQEVQAEMGATLLAQLAQTSVETMDLMAQTKEKVEWEAKQPPTEEKPN